MKFEEVKQKKINKEMLPQVISRIFSICKTDKNFPLREQIGEVDRKISAIKRKIIKQSDLFKQSKELGHALNERLNILEDRNAGLKERLLESLGSEL
jgi:septal ring factor EnvC (AmiA/AmiB activator)